KTLTLPEAPGRALGIAGAGGGLTARSLGECVGQENHTLIEAEMPSHTHTLNNSANLVQTTGAGASPDGPPGNQAVTVTANAAGGGGAHNNMQPTLFLHAFIKL
ncbi:MAG: phage tail protein, partial [Gammaproteobacteria bacterium CG_4_10_14_0_8_um_filter_38_16]